MLNDYLEIFLGRAIGYNGVGCFPIAIAITSEFCFHSSKIKCNDNCEIHLKIKKAINDGCERQKGFEPSTLSLGS